MNHGCQCPKSWWGVLPPPCPLHNPAQATITTTGTNNLAAPTSLDGLREALLAEGIEAFRLTREYVGEDTLPALPGWSWFDWTEKALAALRDEGETT